MTVTDKILKMAFGEFGGLKKSDLDVARYKFSDLLPYTAYDEQDEFYYLKDNSIGWVYECIPLIFAGKTMDNLTAIFKMSLPEKSIIQTVLYADPYIEDILAGYQELRYSNPNLNDIYKAQTENYCKFFRGASRKGLWNLSGTPIRNFRLYISIKAPLSSKVGLTKGSKAAFEGELKRIKDSISDIKQNLVSAGLNPRSMHPNDFLYVLQRIFNPQMTPHRYEWNDDKPLSKQVINGETAIIKEHNSLKIGNMYARCLTPKEFPTHIDSTYMNNLIGYFAKSADSMGDDSNQIRCPFIMSTSFILENTNKMIDAKMGFINAQRASGGLAYAVQARREEMAWIKTTQEKDNEKFIRVIPQLWLFDEDENNLSDNINRVASMWTNLNTASQKELSFIMPKMFVSALPLGLYGNDYLDLERDFVMQTQAAAHMMTIQAGCIGLGKPYMMFIDRRAQLTALDILYTGANKNFLMTGGSGGGKSFFLNYLCNSYLSTGAKIRIIDVGESYKKMAEMFDGQFMKFAGSDIVINFFESVGDINDTSTESKSQDTADKISMLTGILATMCSKSERALEDIHITLLETAIRANTSIYGGATTIDIISEWLRNYEATDDKDIELAREARYLSVAMQKYTSNGEYGKYFNGKSNVDIKGDLTVIELDGTAEDLRRVVVLAFANIIEDEIYNGDRRTPTIVVLDEAWQTLSENPAAARFAEGLYRKIRKYNGAVGIATQSVMDLQPDGKLGQLGGVIQMQSNMHFMLPDIALSSDKKKSYVDLSDFAWIFLADKLPSKSLPRYSEFLVKSDKFVAAVRLTTDEFTYFVCSSDATDNLFLNYYKKLYMDEDKTLTPNEAMVKAIDKATEICKQRDGVGGFKHYVNTEFMAILNRRGA